MITNEEEQYKIVESIKDDLIVLLECYVMPKDNRDFYFKCLNVDIHNIIKEYKRAGLIYEFSYQIQLLDDSLFIRITIYALSVYDTDHYIELDIDIKEKKEEI